MSATKRNLPVFDPGLCRCCGSLKKCRLLNTEYECLGQKEVYSDLIKGCFDLLLSHLDGKPAERLICATCVTRLREADAFKRQVMMCEEAFLQMKIYDESSCEVSAPPLSLVTVEIVKQEPYEPLCSPGASPRSDQGSADAAADDGSAASDDVPLRALRQPRPERAGPSRRRAGDAARKGGKKLPMSRLQQLNRERDVTYVKEVNTLNIVEYSYVCPFKCRHNNYLCYYCGQLCADPTALREHTHGQHHPGKFKIYERKKMIKMDITRIDCRLCDAKIAELSAFKEHLKAHDIKYYPNYPDSILPFKLTSNELTCALCDTTYPYFHALNKHMNVHFRNYVCETCGLGFVDRCRFVMHQLRHENGEYPCQVCGKVFRAQYNRELHVDRVHNRKGRVYCPKCDVTLMSYPQKLKHLVEVHGEAPLSFPCGLCDKVCPTRRMLTIHKRKDHLKDYRYDCKYCGQKFFTNFALQNHLPVHTCERNFKCKVCEKAYPRLKTLRDHMRIHNNDRRFRCHVCGQTFIQNCSLKGHIKSQHPEYG